MVAGRVKSLTSASLLRYVISEILLVVFSGPPMNILRSPVTLGVLFSLISNVVDLGSMPPFC